MNTQCVLIVKILGQLKTLLKCGLMDTLGENFEGSQLEILMKIGMNKVKIAALLEF